MRPCPAHPMHGGSSTHSAAVENAQADARQAIENARVFVSELRNFGLLSDADFAPATAPPKAWRNWYYAPAAIENYGPGRFSPEVVWPSFDVAQTKGIEAQTMLASFGVRYLKSEPAS